MSVSPLPPPPRPASGDRWSAPPAQPPVWDPADYGYGPARPTPTGDDPPPPPPKPVQRARLSLIAAGIIGGILAGAVAIVSFLWLDADGTDSVETVFNLPEPGSNSTLSDETLDIQGVLAKVQPSVVTINTGAETPVSIFSGTGSGVVIGETGLILTNAHVIDNADTIEVIFFDGTVAPARLVGSFPDDDIAVIQADGVRGLVPAELGESEQLRVGDDVVAIGNALDLGGTPSVTRGIVSATERSISAEGISLSNLIQTDAAINPGNSGGPLVNAFGQVVGINTAIIDDAQNINFAIAIDVVKPLIERVASGDADLRPDIAFLGVSSISVDRLDSAVRAQFDVTAETGAFVQSLVDGSPATDSGIERGDVIVELAGEPVTTATDVARIIRSLVPGNEVDVVVQRGDDAQTFTVELGTR